MTQATTSPAAISSAMDVLLAETPWNMVVTSHEGQILAMSRVLLDLFEQPAGLIGQSFELLVLDHEQRQVRALFDQIQLGEPVAPLRVHLNPPRRFPLAVEIELHPIHEDSAKRVTVVIYPVSMMHRRERIILEFNRLAPHLLMAQSAEELYARAMQALDPLGMGMVIATFEPGQAALQLGYLGFQPGMLAMLRDLAQIDPEQLRIPRDAPGVAEAIEQRRAIYIDDFHPLLQALLLDHNSALLHALLSFTGIPGCIVAPLLAGHEVLGLVVVWSHVLNREQVPFIEAFAHQIAAVLAQIDLREQMQRQVQRLNSLATTAQAVTTLGSLDEVLRVVCMQAQELLGGEFARVAAPVGQLGAIKYIMSTGIGAGDLLDIAIPINASVSGTVFRTGQGRVIDDLRASTDVYAPFREHSPARSVLYQPLQHRGTVLGVLIVGHSRAGFFNQSDLGYLERYAEYAAVAITNAKLHAALQVAASDNARLYREAEAVRNYLNTLVQNTPDLLLTIQPDMTIRLLNPERMTWKLPTPLSQGDLLSFLELAPPHIHAELVRRWESLQPHSPQSFELEMNDAEGRPFYLLLSAVLLADYGEVFVIVKDVTEQRRHEAYQHQTEKLAALGRMLAGAAHELNNPLAAILGLAQLQLADDIPEPLYGDMERIERAALRARTIVQQLLTFARPQPPQAEPVAVAGLIDETIERLGDLLSASRIEVRRELAGDLPPLHGDPHQLEQVLFNVLHNAVQSLAANSPDRPRRLHIGAQLEDDSVLISIEDSGPGIPPQHLAHVFEPFFTTRVVGQGTGLGLAICHAIIQQHGGQIWVKSQPERGATFYIRLPYTEPAVLAPEATSLPLAKVAGMRILLVEDEDTVRFVVAQVLQRHAMVVDAVASGSEAIELALANEYQLVISDIRMPGIDGPTLYARLASRRPNLRWMILTGDTMSERSQRFLARSGLPTLAKPFTNDQLLAQVVSCLGSPVA